MADTLLPVGPQPPVNVTGVGATVPTEQSWKLPFIQEQQAQQGGQQAPSGEGGGGVLPHRQHGQRMQQSEYTAPWLFGAIYGAVRHQKISQVRDYVVKWNTLMDTRDNLQEMMLANPKFQGLPPEEQQKQIDQMWQKTPEFQHILVDDPKAAKDMFKALHVDFLNPKENVAQQALIKALQLRGAKKNIKNLAQLRQQYASGLAGSMPMAPERVPPQVELAAARAPGEMAETKAKTALEQEALKEMPLQLQLEKQKIDVQYQEVQSRLALARAQMQNTQAFRAEEMDLRRRQLGVDAAYKKWQMGQGIVDADGWADMVRKGYDFTKIPKQVQPMVMRAMGNSVPRALSAGEQKDMSLALGEFDRLKQYRDRIMQVYGPDLSKWPTKATYSNWAAYKAGVMLKQPIAGLISDLSRESYSAVGKLTPSRSRQVIEGMRGHTPQPTDSPALMKAKIDELIGTYETTMDAYYRAHGYDTNLATGEPLPPQGFTQKVK